MEEKQKRLLSLDIAKAICIILVVIGHYHPRNAPQWYLDINHIIYSFHMPLFMFASGYIYIATQNNISYSKFIKKKIKRLMIPYLSTSLIIITIKLFSQKIMFVEHPVTVSSYIKMFYQPEAGYFLWFIWALWWMFVIVPVFKSKRARGYLFLASILLLYLPIQLPELFCLRQFQNMLIYFMSGVFFYENKNIINRKTSLLKSYHAAMIFAILQTLNLFIMERNSSIIVNTATAFAGIWATMALSAVLQNRINKNKLNWLLTISTSSYIIYLFHTTFEGFAKAVCYKIPVADNPWYILLPEVTTVVLIGIVGPTLLHQYVLQKTNITRLLFGLKENKNKSLNKKTLNYFL